MRNLGSEDEGVNPARAGMILRLISALIFEVRKPRASGDDPPTDFQVYGNSM